MSVLDPAENANPEPRPPAAPEPAATGSRSSRWLVAGLVLLGLALTILFALRATRSFRIFHNERGRPPREATGAIEPWMTIPYVAAAYSVPESFLYTNLGVDPVGNARKSLMQLERTYFNNERGVLRTRIQAALDLYYAGSAVPTPIVPDPASIPKPEEPIPGGHQGPHDAPAPPSAPPGDAAPAAGDVP